MAIPTPYTWVDSTTPPAATLNAGHKTVMAFLLAPPRCKAFRSTAGTALTAGTSTAVNLDGEQYDSTGGMHSLVSNLSRIVAPEDGLYAVTAQFAVASQTSSIVLDIRLNAAGNPASGSSQAAQRFPHIASSTTFGAITVEVPMNANDYLELFANLSVTQSPTTGVQNTYMSIRWSSSL